MTRLLDKRSRTRSYRVQPVENGEPQPDAEISVVAGSVEEAAWLALGERLKRGSRGVAGWRAKVFFDSAADGLTMVRLYRDVQQ
jgi:hypothetical protein